MWTEERILAQEPDCHTTHLQSETDCVVVHRSIETRLNPASIFEFAGIAISGSIFEVAI
jgi:hypothetical protein